MRLIDDAPATPRCTCRRSLRRSTCIVVQVQRAEPDVPRRRLIPQARIQSQVVRRLIIDKRYRFFLSLTLVPLWGSFSLSRSSGQSQSCTRSTSPTSRTRCPTTPPYTAGADSIASCPTPDNRQEISFLLVSHSCSPLGFFLTLTVQWAKSKSHSRSYTRECFRPPSLQASLVSAHH